MPFKQITDLKEIYCPKYQEKALKTCTYIHIFVFRYPCFGYGKVSAKNYWKLIVQDTFQKCKNENKCNFNDNELEIGFNSILYAFTQPETYFLYPEAHQFLQWSRNYFQQIIFISNSHEV